MTSQDLNQASQGCPGGLVKKLVKDASPTFFPFELTLKSPPNYSPKFPVALATGPSSYYYYYYSFSTEFLPAYFSYSFYVITMKLHSNDCHVATWVAMTFCDVGYDRI